MKKLAMSSSNCSKVYKSEGEKKEKKRSRVLDEKSNRGYANSDIVLTLLFFFLLFSVLTVFADWNKVKRKIFISWV